MKNGERNLQADEDAKADTPKVIKSKREHDSGEATMSTIDPADLIGRTFLMPPEEDGTRLRAKIIEAIETKERDLANDPVRIKFRCSVNDNEYEEIIAYNEILSHLEQDQHDDGLWRFKSITGHQGPLSKSDPAYKGSRFNVLVNWETGESTYEPLHIVAADDPVTCAIYGKENNLLDQEGWRRFRRLANRQKKLLRFAKQAKLRSVRHKPVYKYGFLVPCSHDQAMELDLKNGNTKWREAEMLEMAQLHDYKTFVDKGQDAKIPHGYKKI